MTALSDRDPDEARLIADSALDVMIEAIHHHDGVVTVTGDSISALFGTPLPQEDHPLRACRAALRMQQAFKALAARVQREHDVSLRLRIALDSGEAIVSILTPIGATLHMDYGAVGGPAILAALLLDAAEPDTILMGEGSADAVRTTASLEPAPSIELTGGVSVRAYRLLRVGSAQPPNE